MYKYFSAGRERERKRERGSLHTSQVSHLLLYLSLWLLFPGLSSHFCYCFLYNLVLRSALVSNIFEKWLQDFECFGNAWGGSWYQLQHSISYVACTATLGVCQAHHMVPWKLQAAWTTVRQELHLTDMMTHAHGPLLFQGSIQIYAYKIRWPFPLFLHSRTGSFGRQQT